MTLIEILASTGLHRRSLAPALGWPLDELPTREQQPAKLTLAEIEQIARLTGQSVAQLMAWFREEVRARVPKQWVQGQLREQAQVVEVQDGRHTP